MTALQIQTGEALIYKASFFLFWIVGLSISYLVILVNQERCALHI
ncbi:hypothetical protein GCM10008013_10630 [Paenibacillus segetis]|uniref:Uncharacterized protein n=1 Tax=Paenibacillus segetis TaxID=1325360 RepID=A0ABQ1Y842_9BACL|nr:hypothetical protein GCM10008013_10630 [Paenibacillus segetis]